LYFQASLKKDGVEAVNSAAAAAYLNQRYKCYMVIVYKGEFVYVPDKYLMVSDPGDSDGVEKSGVLDYLRGLITPSLRR